jgi:hypothetical protein
MSSTLDKQLVDNLEREPIDQWAAVILSGD